MVSINYSSREVCCKIVYYGPGLSGKTTNLQYIHAKVPQTTRGKLISLATEADRTLYFDFLPINIGSINGFTAKFQLYTVPGQVYYNATRKLVLRGVDGIVFVADSQTDKMDENLESLLNLEENLAEYGYSMDEIPFVIQYNKQDLPNVMTIEQLNAQLNKRGWPCFGASATVGNGVFDTLKLVIKLVLDKAKTTSTARQRPAATPAFEMPAPASHAEAMPMGAATGPTPEPVASRSGGIPIAAAHAPYESAAYRPYPGSERAVERESSYPAPAPPAPVAAAPEVRPADEITDAHISPAAVEQSTGRVTPSMAPSVRRRGETKKRGFFKRLFGLK